MAENEKQTRRLRDRVRDKLQRRRERTTDRARHRSEHQRNRERDGEVSRHGQSDSGGFTSFETAWGDTAVADAGARRGAV